MNDYKLQNERYARLNFWMTDILNGSLIFRHYLDLKKFEKMTYEDAERYRKAKFMDLINFVNKNSKYYSNLNLTSLKDFPIMNKSSLLEKHSEISIPSYKIPFQIGNMHFQSTSGSTGTPFKIPQDSRKRNIRIAELKFFGEKVGYKTHNKLIHLRTWNRYQSKTPAQITSENIIPFDISKIGETELSNLVELINHYKIKALRGYASTFDLFAKHLRDNNLKCPSLEIIIAGSESLNDDTREIVKQFLDCEIISQYANEECGILAQEAIYSHPAYNPMYLNHANYIFECLSFDSDKPVEYGELGRLVVTDLSNYAFPLIRYDTGDTAIFDKPDQYSNGLPVLSKLYGRKFDLCYTTSGEVFSPMTIGRILKNFDKISQWQFIQVDRNSYLLKIVSPVPELNEYLEIAVMDFKKALGDDAIIEIKNVDEIPVLQSGKRKPVINEWLIRQNKNE